MNTGIAKIRRNRNNMLKRDRAIIWSTPVSDGNSSVGSFILYEGVEPVDAVHKFIVENNMTIGYRHAILSEVCDFIECHRAEPGELK